MTSSNRLLAVRAQLDRLESVVDVVENLLAVLFQRDPFIPISGNS